MSETYRISISWLSVLLILLLGFENTIAFSTPQTLDCSTISAVPDCPEEVTCCCSEDERTGSCCDAPDHTSVSNIESCHCGIFSNSNQPATPTRYYSEFNSYEKKNNNNCSVNSYTYNGIFHQNTICISCSSLINTCPSPCIAKVRLRL